MRIELIVASIKTIKDTFSLWCRFWMLLNTQQL